MQKICRVLVVFSAGAFLCTLAAYGQDSTSLADVARQLRVQKQQKEQGVKDAATQNPSAKDPQAKDAQPQTKDPQAKDALAKNAPTADQSAKDKKVITNDEIPEHVGPTRTAAAVQKPPVSVTDAPPTEQEEKLSADDWKAQVQSQKNYIASTESDIRSLNESIQYAGANCVANCAEWNERQKQKQDQVESLKVQLEEQKKHLEELQEGARKQGYGSSVYEP
jgi:hypothetical protein